jgi:hypothetical protein
MYGELVGIVENVAGDGGPQGNCIFSAGLLLPTPHSIINSYLQNRVVMVNIN